MSLVEVTGTVSQVKYTKMKRKCIKILLFLSKCAKFDTHRTNFLSLEQLVSVTYFLYWSHDGVFANLFLSRLYNSSSQCDVSWKFSELIIIEKLKASYLFILIWVRILNSSCNHKKIEIPWILKPKRWHF